MPLLSLTMAMSALFVIDIQKDLASIPGTKIPHSDRVVLAAEKAIAGVRGEIDRSRGDGQQPHWMIVFVQHEEDETQGALVRGTEPWGLVFEPREHDEHEMVVGKTTR